MSADQIARHVHQFHFNGQDQLTNRELDLTDLYIEFLEDPELDSAWFEDQLNYMWMR